MRLKIEPIVSATTWSAEAAIWMKLFSIINRKEIVLYVKISLQEMKITALVTIYISLKLPRHKIVGHVKWV